MESLMSQFGYLLIAGVVLGLLGFAAAFFADKSVRITAKREGKEVTETATIGCGFNCGECTRFDSCGKAGKKEQA